MTSSDSNGTLQPVNTTRNTTVLPHVEAAGASIEIKPRNETRYQRLKRLGSGAMGEVNLVRDNDIGRTVAVKQLVHDAQNPAGLARFISEIRTIGRLEHPNIVPIHDVGVDEQGQIFFVMKHIDGETLEHIIEKLDACDPAYLAKYTLDYRVEIFLGLLRALQFAHAQGVIHRDIKPAIVSFVGNQTCWFPKSSQVLGKVDAKGRGFSDVMERKQRFLSAYPAATANLDVRRQQARQMARSSGGEALLAAL